MLEVSTGVVVDALRVVRLLRGPARVWAAMVQQGVLIREVGPAGWLRVSVGTPCGDMATCGYSDVKECQRVEVVLAPYAPA